MKSTMRRYRELVRTISALAAVFIAVFVCHADASSVPPAPDYHVAIKSAYDQMVAAFADNHLDRGAALMADDYRQIDRRKLTLDKNGTIKQLQAQRNQVRSIQSKVTIESMTLQADGVHVEMETHSAGTGVKQVLFVTVRGRFVSDMRVDDIWVSTHGGWRLKLRHVLVDEQRVSPG